MNEENGTAGAAVLRNDEQQMRGGDSSGDDNHSDNFSITDEPMEEELVSSSNTTSPTSSRPTEGTSDSALPTPAEDKLSEEQDSDQDNEHHAFPALSMWRDLMEHVRAYHCSHRRHRKIGRPCFTGKRLVAYVWDFLKARPEERFQKATTEQALNIAERLHRQGLFAALKAARNEKPLRDNLKYKYRVAPAEEVKALPGMA